ncbi:MAG: hypothetical protein QG555_324, partial [Thermodesulfobacteriota bacterium]|nr:hypothetical protein [Thermodesulfobacteriota bacterium]
VPYVVLMPAFARDILHGGPHTLGFLMSASGAGALMGAIYLAAQKSILGLGIIIPLASGIFGAGLVGLPLFPVFWLSILLMTIIGFGVMVQVASSNTLLQTIVEDNKRGRVMSFFAVSFMGMAPLGSLMAGTLAGMIGITTTIMFGGICCIVGAIFFVRKLPLLRSIIRPLYVDKGIIGPD